MIAVAPVQAAAEKQKSSKAENVGVMSGLVIGAAAGGPIGAVVGAVGGAFLGDRFHKKEVQNDELKLSLAKSESEKQKLRGDLASTMAHGEKLSEELFTPEEHAERTSFEQILIGRSEESVADDFLGVVDGLLAAASARDWVGMDHSLSVLIKGFELGPRGTLQAPA